MKTERTRENILAAALALFSQRGFLGATTRQIAREAGVAEVTLFRHFGSKEKLFEAVIRGYSFLPAMRGILPGLEKVPYEKALLAVARRFLATLDERRDLIRIMLAERQFYPSEVRGIFREMLGEMFGMLAGYFREQQQRGMLREFDPEAGAKAFLGSFFAYVHGLGFFFENGADRKSRDRFAAEYVRLFVEGTIRRHPAGTKRRESSRRGRNMSAGAME